MAAYSTRLKIEQLGKTVNTKNLFLILKFITVVEGAFATRKKRNWNRATHSSNFPRILEA